MYISLNLQPETFVPLKSFYFDEPARYYFKVGDDFYYDVDI